jgi:hypothetical protein
MMWIPLEIVRILVQNSSVLYYFVHSAIITFSIKLGQYTESQEVDEETTYEEDNYSKVLRSLEHKDSVLDIYNISRITGLDACGKY